MLPSSPRPAAGAPVATVQCRLDPDFPPGAANVPARAASSSWIKSRNETAGGQVGQQPLEPGRLGGLR
eukprot:COSAG04_NODE_10957_length_741_cov_0.961059_1_plen_67_part_01